MRGARAALALLAVGLLGLAAALSGERGPPTTDTVQAPVAPAPDGAGAGSAAPPPRQERRPVVERRDVASAASPDAGRACRQDSDCPPRQGCVPRAEGPWRCAPADCATDDDCLAGELCRVVNDTSLGPPLHRCVTPGSRRAGQSCTPAYLWPELSCEEGLVCSNVQCGVPCLGDGGCPGGGVCLDDGRGDGPACFLGCDTSGCPDGSVCLGRGHPGSRCAVVRGPSCLQEPCPEGERCIASLRGSPSAMVALTWCARQCEPLVPGSCPDGSVCGRSVGPGSICYPACAADGGCAERSRRCLPVTEDGQVVGCRP